MDVSGLRFSGFGIFPEPEISNIVIPFMWPPKQKISVSTESHRKGMGLKPSAATIGGLVRADEC